jgi:hypothetical protein
MDGYVRDSGANNASVGHRRWLLHPPTQKMGTGDLVDAASLLEANALWVLDTPNLWRSASTRDGFVAWPHSGYVPYALVPVRWSFGLPEADFTSATVRLSVDGVEVPVTQEPVAVGFGVNTLVWYPSFLDPTAALARWPRPSGDTRYLVEIQNAMVAGTARDFSYPDWVLGPGTWMKVPPLLPPGAP